MRPEMLKMARAYIAMGLPIIPLCTHDHHEMLKNHQETCANPGKRPLLKNWASWGETTMENFQDWTKTYGDFNLGLPLGGISGYVGIDVDGAEGEDILQDMSHGDLPDTWEYTTGAGRRLLYQIPYGMETKKFKQAGGAEHTECALICTGQQTVLPPSIHSSGRVYTWTEGHTPDVLDCAEAPKWLIDAIRVTPEQKRDKKLQGFTLNLNDPNSLITAFTPSADTSELMVDLPPGVDASSVPVGGKKNGSSRQKPTISAEELTQVIPAGQRDDMMTKIIGHYCATNRNLGKEALLALALDHNDRYCDPPLEAVAIEAKVNHFWEAEQIKGASYRQGGKGTSGTEEWDPMKFAQIALNLLEEEGYCIKIQNIGDVVWMCTTTKGPWRSYDTKTTNFQSKIVQYITDPENGGSPANATKNRLNDVVHSFCMTLRTQERLWDKDGVSLDTQALSSAKLIPIKDGKLLDWETGTVLPWDPDTNLTYCLPIDYNPNEPCPMWEKRLEEWLPELESRMLVQEFIGYSLIPYMGFEKALLLIGGGANGKSLFLETIQGMLGKEVTDALNMKTLFSNFGAQYLEGKILNIANEAAADYLKNGNADEFKNLVSGGTIRADVKNQQAKYFSNTAKFIFSANNEVKTTDKSEGWERRLVIVPFEQSFMDSKVPKHQIINELRNEYLGIFNWAVQGLQRLMKQASFTTSIKAQERKQKYLANNDLPEDFFQNCLELVKLSEIQAEKNATGGISTIRGVPTSVVNELFDAWTEYRESQMQKKKTKIKEYLTEKQHLRQARTDKFYNDITGTKTSVWVNLRLNIRDIEFLEMLQEEGSAKIREYCLKQLKTLDTTA